MEPKLAPDGLLCFLSSSICIFLGSYGTHARTLVSASIACNSCFKYTVISSPALSPDYHS